ncbi:MAG: aldehyde dehydrogenase (NADP(+)), partial [Salibacteraceae bacterium]
AANEKGRTVGQLRSFAAMLQQGDFLGDVIQKGSEHPCDLRKTQIPIGPVVVFGASNFPLAFSTAGGDTASALAAGCPVIVKGHPMHAGTGEMIAEAVVRAVQKCHLPDGVFSNLNSQGIEVGVQLVQHPKVKAVGFTGSLAAGKALQQLAQERKVPIPVFAEMGSINPVILSEAALQQNGKHWAEQLAASVALGTGQFCTKPGLLVAVSGDSLEVFKEQLTQKLNAASPGCMLHANIKNTYEQHKQLALQQAGVETLTASAPAPLNDANQCLAVTEGSAFLANPQLHEEVFGPYSLLVACDNAEEMMQVIDQLEGQLTGTIIAEPDEEPWVAKIVEALIYKVGRIIYNGVPTGVDVSKAMPHGGPFPATTHAKYTSVGLDAVQRWLRPISYQNFPTAVLPDHLR